MITKAPLELENFFYPVVSITASPHYDEKHYNRVFPAEALEVKAAVLKMTEEDHKYQLQLHLSVSDECEDSAPLPYQVDILSIAFADFTKGAGGSENDYGKIAASTIPIMYAAAREMVLTVTSRGPWGGRLLPTVSPVDLIKEVDILEFIEENKEGPNKKQKQRRKKSN